MPEIDTTQQVDLIDEARNTLERVQASLAVTSEAYQLVGAAQAFLTEAAWVLQEEME